MTSDPRVVPEPAADESLAKIRSAAFVAFKGPHYDDAHYLLTAAKRLDGNYDVGGSNVRATVARVLRAVAETLPRSESVDD